jgi:hypothetical protein
MASALTEAPKAKLGEAADRATRRSFIRFGYHYYISAVSSEFLLEYHLHFRLVFACFSGTSLLIIIPACISRLKGVVVGTFVRSKHFRTALGLQ